MSLSAQSSTATYRSRSLCIWGCVLVAILFLSGCHVEDGSNLASSKTATPETMLAQLRQAVEIHDWEAANALSHSALLHYQDDPDVLELVARAAHGSGSLEIAADLMRDACFAESFANSERSKQAIASLLATGRVHDVIALLESAAVEQPDQYSLRQMLYQLCWVVEDRPRSLPHGRYLIRKRQFDLDLLLAMSATELREESSDSLIEMANRHPTDKRPLIAEARIQFDRRHFSQATNLLRESLQNHPDHSPAIALLSRTLVDSGRYGDFVELAKSAPKDTEDQPFFWLAKGDWCAVNQLHAQAARAYWEATLRDLDLRHAWLKLSASLKLLGSSKHGLGSAQIAAIDCRVMLLSRFSQTRAEFVKSGKSSSTLAIELAKTLQDLGRLWEAEAWASIAMTLAGGSTTSEVSKARQSIVKSLRRTTPWQETAAHAELQIDLTTLALPKIASNVKRSIVKKRVSSTYTGRPVPISLEDQAETRSLTFFGSTGSQLHEPGILFYQTLGCGGGTIDFDLDGWSDLYLAAAGGTPPSRDSQSNSLCRNLNGNFQDVTLQSDSGDTGFGQGVAVGDVNEDGFADLMVMNYGLNSLLLNNGDGTFSNATESLGSTNLELEWSSSGAIADIDGDGLADLTILNYGSGLEPVTRQCLHPTTQIARACSPLVFPGVADRFLLNTGSSETGDVGFIDQTSQFGEPSVIGRGLGLIVGAFDADARIGIFVANDMNSNHFWSQPSDGETLLHETGIMRGLGSDDRTPAQGSMGIAAADLDGDGDLDLYVTNFQGEPNTYHEQISTQLYRDQTRSLKLAQPTIPLVGFGTEAIDFDNNGTLELAVLNGHIDDFPGDASGPYAQPMQIFQRQSTGEFASIADTIGGDYASQPHVGRALWTLDANRDGRIDLVATHQTEPVALLMNQTENAGNWISLKLAGKFCSRDAIGSRIEVQCEDLTTTGFLVSGHGFLCSNEQVIHFGLAEHRQPCQLKVTWPDGSVDMFDDLDVNHNWLLVQGSPSAFQLK